MVTVSLIKVSCLEVKDKPRLMVQVCGGAGAGWRAGGNGILSLEGSREGPHEARLADHGKSDGGGGAWRFAVR